MGIKSSLRRPSAPATTSSSSSSSWSGRRSEDLSATASKSQDNPVNQESSRSSSPVRHSHHFFFFILRFNWSAQALMLLLNQFEDTATLQQCFFYTFILTSHIRNQTVRQRSLSAAKPTSRNQPRMWSNTLTERWADLELLRWTFIFSCDSKRDSILTLIQCSVVGTKDLTAVLRDFTTYIFIPCNTIRVHDHG